MLPKSQKVARSEFPKDFRDGKRYSSANMSMLVFKLRQDLPNKYACIISSKVSKKAVSRNKIRRRLYSVLKTYNKKGFLCLFFIKKGSSKVTFKEIKNETSGLLKNI